VAVHRSWIFRTIGYGHSINVWNDIVSALCLSGYDVVVSIEHEDALISPAEGLLKAISFMKQALLFKNI